MEHWQRFPRKQIQAENAPPDRVYSDPYDTEDHFKVDPNYNDYTFDEHEAGIYSAVDNVVKGMLVLKNLGLSTIYYV